MWAIGYLVILLLVMFNLMITTNTCWKCKTEMGTFLYLIWECSMVKPCWHNILEFLGTWAGETMPVSPRLCLLGDETETPTLKKNILKVSQYLGAYMDIEIGFACM
uniref:Uncharacterized protein n=1 Tax=Sander lucioperca TaxID=283035 RepID=A0A8D0CSR3_SANLU